MAAAPRLSLVPALILVALTACAIGDAGPRPMLRVGPHLPASEPPPAPAPAPVPAPTGPLSARLKNAGLASPMPRGNLGGWGGDTGLDIAGDHLEVFAVAAGTLDYSEWGHTRWTTGKDTAFSVRLALDEPIAWSDRGEHRVTHVYYTHLSKVDTAQAEGSKIRKHVITGERIGVSGIGNGTPHLHLGFLLDNEVEQDSWTFILREHEVRKVLGNYKNGARLP